MRSCQPAVALCHLMIYFTAPHGVHTLQRPKIELLSVHSGDPWSVAHVLSKIYHSELWNVQFDAGKYVVSLKMSLAGCRKTKSITFPRVSVSGSMVWEVLTQSAVTGDSTHETAQSSETQTEHTGIECWFSLTVLEIFQYILLCGKKVD